MLSTVDVTVVIGTYNRAGMLRQALESLAAQETGGKFRYEIVVADNASTDETAGVIRTASPGNAEAVRGVTETRRGVAAARNAAIEAARGRWLAFHDDDQIADPRWLAELLTTAQEHASLVVGGDVKLLLPDSTDRDLSPVCRRLLGEMVGMQGVERFDRKRVPGTNNLLIERSVIERVGKFDESEITGGEDAELYRRIRSAGYQCWFAPRAIVHHMIPEYRLDDAYMRWTSMRHGGHVAERELRDWGRAVLPLVCLGRVGQAVGVYFPRYVWARLRRDRESALGARCLLCRSEGYLRTAATRLLPGVFGADALRSALDFREGRQKLADRGS